MCSTAAQFIQVLHKYNDQLLERNIMLPKNPMFSSLDKKAKNPIFHIPVTEKENILFFLMLCFLNFQVSLDSRVRETINRNMQEPNLHTFDDAQLQIYTLMQRDSYPRYLNSLAYKNLLKPLSEQSPES